VEVRLSPKLRRANRIRSIHSSLAIENNTLSLSQVTDIISGKVVKGHPREVREVKNAMEAYAMMEHLDPASPESLLAAHGKMMAGLADDAGRYRRKGVGIYRGSQLVHMAPPADRVPYLVKDLLKWLGGTELHPVLAGAVVHYELEFIHPFSDGNGRMGRLWQTLVLARWRPRLAYLPVETVVHHRQQDYYAALAASDQAADSAPFAEFILEAVQDALNGAAQTDQATDQVTDQVKRLLGVLAVGEEVTAAELMSRLGLAHRPTFRANYLRPALAAGLVVMTQPDSPRSPTQRYRRA
jgi:Fic family protein